MLKDRSTEPATLAFVRYVYWHVENLHVRAELKPVTMCKSRILGGRCTLQNRKREVVETLSQADKKRETGWRCSGLSWLQGIEL